MSGFKLIAGLGLAFTLSAFAGAEMQKIYTEGDLQTAIDDAVHAGFIEGERFADNYPLPRRSHQPNEFDVINTIIQRELKQFHDDTKAIEEYYKSQGKEAQPK